MASIMDSVPSILGIDKVNMNGKLMVIEEQHDSNANFLLNAIISNALKKNYKVCFILFHNTFHHYHNVGMKFGYNLALLREQNKVVTIEPIKIIASNIDCIYGQTTNNMHNTFMIIRDTCQTMAKNNEPVVIIIDDLSHLCNLGYSLRECLYHIRYLRSLVEYNNIFQLYIVAHMYKNELQNCTINILSSGLKHMAHLIATVEPFETGYSSDTSGKITINWKVDSIRAKYNWPEIVRYIYKLSDRQVQIYAPGASALLA